jgi:hypothetical protein
MVNFILAQASYGEPDRAGAIVGLIFGVGGMLVGLLLAVLMIASMWKVFSKAGQPGWASLIPIYNLVVLLKVVDKPLWWLILFVVPCANIIGWVLVSLALAEKFGKSAGFGIGLALLGVIFMPILAFGSAEYQG